MEKPGGRLLGGLSFGANSDVGVASRNPYLAEEAAAERAGFQSLRASGFWSIQPCSASGCSASQVFLAVSA